MGTRTKEFSELGYSESFLGQQHVHHLEMVRDSCSEPPTASEFLRVGLGIYLTSLPRDSHALVSEVLF